MKLSNLVIATLFLVITMANSLKVTTTFGYYALFTEDFIERFCENKDKPMLQCEGKCELSKMLVQEADDDKLPINLELLKNETVLFLASFFKVDILEFTTAALADLYYMDHYTFDFSYNMIHPPRV